MAYPSRYIPHNNVAPLLHDVHDLRSMSSTIRETLVRDLPRVIDHSESRSVDIGSVYIGLEGTVVLNDYISSMKSLAISTNEDTSKTLLIRSAHAYGGKIPSVKYGARSSFLETSTGIATLVLVAEERNAGPGTFRDLVPLCTQNLQDATKVALQNEGGDPDDGCEVLYGRAGLLYALLLLRKTCEKASSIEISHLYSDETLRGLVKEVLRRGQLGAAAYVKAYRGSSSTPALMWSWHGKRYLGGAHGVVGILQMLVSSPIHIIELYMPLILNTTEWILSLQDDEGNWPPIAPESDHTRGSDLVHWCHGAPATLIYLSNLYRRQDISQRIPQELRLATEKAMKRGAHLIYSQGLLRKGVGLCHGIGGSVFALLSVSRAFAAASRTEAEEDLAPQQSMKYLRQAAHLALVATHWQELTRKGEIKLPDHPWSLYEGLAGICAAWAAVVEKVSGGDWSGMPGYELD